MSLPPDAIEINNQSSLPADAIALGNNSVPTAPQRIQSPAPSPSVTDTAMDILGRFGKGAYNATSFLPGIKNSLADRIYGGIPKATTLDQQVPEALGGVAPTIAMAGPYIAAARAAGLSPLLAGAVGFGGFSGSKATLQGKNTLDTVLDTTKGAGTGLLYGLGGAVGEKIASMAAKPIANLISPIAVKTVGSALGQAAVGATTAAPDERLTGALVAGGLGALNPSNVVSKAEYNAQINKNATEYRSLIPPVPSDIRKIETGFTGKDINDSYKLMAQEGVPILSDHGKIDTSIAQKQISDKTSALANQLNNYLDTNNSKQFDLNDIRNKAKAAIDNNQMTALEKETAKKKVDDYINAQISSSTGQGLILDGKNLNNVKQGMYGVAFNNLAPVDAPAARQIASIIKNTIENSYKQQPIKDINNEIGKYATANYLLGKAHGKPVQTKGLGLADTAGAMTGAGLTGLLGASQNPVLGALGAGVGGIMGGKTTDIIMRKASDPRRITGALKTKLDNLTVK